MLEPELSPEEFYEAVLARQGLARGNEIAYFETLAKQAEVSTEEAKLAVQFYEQLARDEAVAGETWYEDPMVRQEDAFKMAAACLRQKDKAEKTATAAADRLLEKLAAAALDWAEDVDVDLDPLDLVEAAGEQAKSARLYHEELQKLAEEKTAELMSLEVPDPAPAESKEAEEGIAPPPAASANQPEFPHPHSFYGSSERGPHTLRAPQAHEALGQALAGTNPHVGTMAGTEAATNFTQMAGHLGYRTPEQQAAFTHNVMEHLSQQGGHPVAAMQAVHQMHQVPPAGKMDAVKGFVGRNKGAIGAGAAVAGLGASLLLRKHRQAKQRKLLEAAQQRAQPQPEQTQQEVTNDL